MSTMFSIKMKKIMKSAIWGRCTVQYHYTMYVSSFDLEKRETYIITSQRIKTTKTETCMTGKIKFYMV